jgi:hypothetical protein
MEKSTTMGLSIKHSLLKNALTVQLGVDDLTFLQSQKQN